MLPCRAIARMGPSHACSAMQIFEITHAGLGLEFLHAHGVIVMDIKPDNLFRNAAGTIQIGDFGLAVTSAQDEVLTSILCALVPRALLTKPTALRLWNDITLPPLQDIWDC